jgi:hypothetical protein
MLPEIFATIVIMLWIGWSIKTKSELNQTKGLYANIIEKAMQAERDKGAALTELEYLKMSIQSLLSRPVQAVLTEAQITTMNQNIAHIVLAGLKPKEKLD